MRRAVGETDGVLVALTIVWPIPGLMISRSRSPTPVHYSPEKRTSFTPAGMSALWPITDIGRNTPEACPVGCSCDQAPDLRTSGLDESALTNYDFRQSS